jgi:uncharacterized protein YyaL (SSP411 family)
VQHANRLIDETSPYLRQHAHNPVDWYPWGEDAFAKARAENKPIFLSVGYSACHWCHVMERESFENEAIARLMNELYVNVKVDREERPDVDQIYMNAVQMLTGRGGWPMSVFLTPEGKPFYGGTYFPPEDRHGMTGFPRVLRAISQAYREKPDDVRKTVGQLMEAIEQMDKHAPAAQPPRAPAVVEAAAKLTQAYDAANGGLGQAPKFPNSSAFELFLRTYRCSGDRRYLEIVLHTLRKMARGGIYDQLGGGFHRYSVDERWLVPHFEKMLYDNAQLVPLFLGAFQASNDPFFARIARETLDYVGREMRDAEGGFYSTQDADSEGVEGKFFVWDIEEVRQLLGEEAAEIACRYWDVTDIGNFESHNILHPILETAQLAKLFGRETAAIEALIDEARRKLFAAREKRVKPGLDDKVLTSWNGLMISAFAKGAEVLGEQTYHQIAIDAVAFIEDKLARGDRLLSSYKNGVAKLNGYLDDYAFFIAGLLDVFELTQERAYLKRADALTESTLTHFWDREGGGFFFTSDDHEQLIARTKPSFDGSIPSGNSVMALNLLRLYHYRAHLPYLTRAEELLRRHVAPMTEQPFGLANMLCSADFYIEKPREIFVIGRLDAADTREHLRRIAATYVPNRTLTVVEPGGEAPVPETMQGKTQINGMATVYVCHRMTCSLAATSWEQIEPLLLGQTSSA